MGLSDFINRHKHIASPPPIVAPLPVPTRSVPATAPVTPPATGGLGLYKLYEGPNAALDIVFVHGLIGTRDNTWTDKQTGIYWPKALLKNDLPESRIWTYGYDADVVKFLSAASQNGVADHGRNLINAVAQERERTESNTRPLIFVVHSLGGLVIESALSTERFEKHLQQVRQSTKGICFLGTPHYGSNRADLAKLLASFISIFIVTNKNLLTTLKPSSEVLATIQEQFYAFLDIRRRQGDEIQVTCFFEEIPMQGAGFIVPKESAKFHGANSIGIHNTHQDMTKFKSRHDPGYIAVMSEIWRWNRDLTIQRQQQQQQQQAPIPINNSPLPEVSHPQNPTTQPSSPPPGMPEIPNYYSQPPPNQPYGQPSPHPYPPPSVSPPSFYANQAHPYGSPYPRPQTVQHSNVISGSVANTGKGIFGNNIHTANGDMHISF